MLWQIALVVLAGLATCHGYPAANNHLQPLLLPRPLPLAASQVLPADATSSAKIKKYTQAGLSLPARGHYLFYYPGGPGSAPVVYAVKDNVKGEEEEEGGGSYFPFGGLYNFFVNWWETTTPVPVEEANPDKEPQKTEADGTTSKPTSGNLETFDEDGPTEPTSPSPIDPKQPEQKLFLIGQPQFFGNYDALKNPEIVKELGNKNPFPNVLLTNQQQPFAWQAKYAPVNYGSPGKAATQFQKLLASSKQKPASQDDNENISPDAYYSPLSKSGASKKPSSNVDSIVVEALKILPHAASEEENEDTEVAEAERGDPSVAQVRPQAIALAGPSGVAAAAPVGTAVVGRGGLAVAAPSATAVAGPSGGEPPIVVPARRTAQQAYLAAHGQARFLEKSTQDDGDDYQLSYST